MKSLKLLCLLFLATLFPSISLNASTATLFVGQSYQTEISSTGYHYLGIESVSSTNPSVTVVKMGLVVKATVNAFFSGEADVIIRLRYQLYAGQAYQYRNQEFTISCNDTQVNISPVTVSIKPGDTYQLSYDFNHATHVTPSFQWSSSDDAIATVSPSGLITAVSEGNATIYLRSNLGSNTSECRVKVSPAESVSGEDHDSSIVDTSWFNENDYEFEISTLPQLLGFRNLVNQGQHFKDKTIKVTQDIDLSSYNWTIPIGIYPNVFEGTFDGCGHSLKIFIDKTETKVQEYYYFGFFGNLWGTIKNLTLKGMVKVDISGDITYAYVGALCGSSSILESCINETSLTYTRTNFRSAGSSDRIGGLAGSGGKYMINCINRGKVLVRSKYSNANMNDYRIGGLTGYSCNMTGCINFGTIENEILGNSDGTLREYIGGICGWCVTDNILRCSNFGDIIGNSNLSAVGGIIGGSGGSSNCSCSYVGKCKIANSRGGSAVYVDGICGMSKNQTDEYSKNYAANDISFTNNFHGGASGSKKYSSSQMKTLDFAKILGSEWIGAEGFYPIVKGSPDIAQYYISTISDITCTSVLVSANIGEVLTNRVKSWGVLLTKDDGKESFIPGSGPNYIIKLTELEPGRNYSLRWFAQDDDGKEFYGIFTSFTTKQINPYTSDMINIGVSSAELTGESYLLDAAKCGFFVQKVDNTDNGSYYWGAHLNEDWAFSLNINNLEGGTKYSYSAVVEFEGVLYAGEVKTFTTKSLMTLAPSGFTYSKVQLNGEISQGLSGIQFEFRPLFLPSVIDSDIINAMQNNNLVFASSPTLQLNESYKYRLVAKNGSETIYGDWVEFLFTGITGMEHIVLDTSVDSQEISVYTLYGIRVFNGFYKDFNPALGIYIIKYKGKSYKIKY